MTVDISPEKLPEAIARLKREKNAVILAHYYTEPEVQDIADFVGDSLALAQQAADTPAEVILFAGVHFMAETAKILSPEKIVLIPDPEAGCSLAESCPADRFAEFVARYPDHKVVSYVNTTADVKALTDVCCTSSNALRIVQSFPPEQPLIFAPDRNLGNYIKSLTGRQNMVIWDGACHVHEDFSPEAIVALRQQYPAAKVVAHPECKAPVLILADFIGSTAAILAHCTTDPATHFIVATEPGILHKLQQANPHKTFTPVPGQDPACACNNCKYMKMITLEKIHHALQTLTPQITLPPTIIAQAQQSIKKMLAL